MNKVLYELLVYSFKASGYGSKCICAYSLSSITLGLDYIVDLLLATFIIVTWESILVHFYF